MKLVKKNCLNCGIDLGEVFHTRKYCTSCSEKIGREQKTIARKKFKAGHLRPLRVIRCVDCGVEFIAHNANSKRCKDCSFVIAQCFHAIRIIRSNLNTKSIVTPAEARAIVEDMLQEEGKDFTEMMVDGLMGKILKKEESDGSEKL